MSVRIERRLSQPRWLRVAVPAGSLVFAFLAAGVVLLATGHNPLSAYRQLFEAGFTQTGALGQTLITATPLAFTGLAAAAAFRMRLYNIGAEGQMYIGTITAGGRGPLLRRPRRLLGVRDRRHGRRRLRRRRGLGADPGRPAGVLPHERDPHLAAAELRRRLPAHLPDLPERVLLAPDQGLQRERLPRPGKPLPSSALWPAWTIHLQGGIPVPLGFGLALLVAVVLWALYRAPASASRCRCSPTPSAPRATAACASGARSSP